MLVAAGCGAAGCTIAVGAGVSIEFCFLVVALAFSAPVATILFTVSSGFSGAFAIAGLMPSFLRRASSSAAIFLSRSLPRFAVYSIASFVISQAVLLAIICGRFLSITIGFLAYYSVL